MARRLPITAFSSWSVMSSPIFRKSAHCRKRQRFISGTLSLTGSRRIDGLDLLSTGTTLSAAAALCTARWPSGEAAGPSPGVGRRDRADMISAPPASWTHMMDTLTSGAPDLQDLGQLRLVLHHHDVGLAVRRHVLTSLGRVGRVNPSCQTASHAQMLEHLWLLSLQINNKH